jgi:hypothetical protein
MLWSYVLVLDDSITRQEAVTLIDQLNSVKNWYACMGHVVLIVSDVSASTLAEQLRPSFSGRRFIVLDAATDRNGWLPKQAWDFLRNPKAAGSSS